MIVILHVVREADIVLDLVLWTMPRCMNVCAGDVCVVLRSNRGLVKMMAIMIEVSQALSLIMADKMTKIM